VISSTKTNAIKAARSMIRLSCSLQDKQKVLSKYDATLPNGDLFISRSSAFKTTLSVQKDFCKDPEIISLDFNITAATKQSSVAVSGYIRDSLKRVISLMKQSSFKQVTFHLVELTKQISNFVFENSLINLWWNEVSATRGPLYFILPFFHDLSSNTPVFFNTYLSGDSIYFMMEATKLFFFKKCLGQKNKALDSAFAYESTESYRDCICLTYKGAPSYQL
jgi:hypothetical protein